jgi:hypothetical protein
MRYFLIVLLALSGCGGPPADRAQAACQRTAENDPAVKDAIERANTDLPQVRIPALRAQKDAMARAVQACLADKGSAPRGGVEPVQQQ